MTDVQVRGKYLLADNTAAHGQVTFTPRAAAVNDATDGDILVGSIVRAALDADGELEVTLQANDDPGLDPTGWTYLVVEEILGVPVRSYDIEVPTSAAGTGIDLVDVAPADPAAGDPSAFPTLASVAALDARITLIEGAAPLARKPALRIAFVGDSITWLGQNAQNLTPVGPQVWANILCGHRFVLVPRDASNYFFATGGYATTDIIAAGYHTSAAASAADIVVVHAGTNDMGLGSTAAVTLANLQVIWDTLLAAGKTVVATTVLPRNVGDISGITAQVRELNALIRAYVPSTPGMVLCDWLEAVLDASTGNLGSSFSGDGLHPNIVGASRLGAVLADCLDSFTATGPPSTSPTLGARGITPNPFASGDSSGMASSWTKTNIGSPSSVVVSKVARSDLGAGAWQQAVVAASNPSNDGVMLSTLSVAGFAPGDQIVTVAEFETDEAGWDCRLMYALTWINGPNTGVAEGFQAAVSGAAIRRPPRGIFVTPPRTIPASPAVGFVQAQFVFRGSGTVRVSRLQVVKVG